MRILHIPVVLTATVIATHIQHLHADVVYSVPAASTDSTPTMRSKSAAATVEKVGYLQREATMVLFGGCDAGGTPLDDMWKIRLDDDATQAVSFAWETVPKAGVWPTARCGHSMQTIPKDGGVLLYGGRGSGSVLHGDVWKYAFISSRWSLLTDKNQTMPPARSGHVSVATQDAMYIFGGWGGVDVANDLWKFSIATGTWSNIIPASARPTKRMGHIGALHGTSLFIYGGWDGSLCLGDIWRYDIVLRIWIKITTENSLQQPPPTPRHGMLLAPITGGMVMLGGVDGNADNLNEAWVFTFPTNVSVRTETTSRSTASETAATVVTTRTSPRNNNSWINVPLVGEEAVGRSYSSGVVWGLSGNETVLLFGGIGLKVDSLVGSEVAILRIGQASATPLPLWPFIVFTLCFILVAASVYFHWLQQRKHRATQRKWQVAYLKVRSRIETRKMLGQDGHNALRVFDKPFAQDGPHGLMRPTLNSRGENHRGSQGGSRGGSSGAPPVGVADGDPSIVSWSRSM